MAGGGGGGPGRRRAGLGGVLGAPALRREPRCPDRFVGSRGRERKGVRGVGGEGRPGLVAPALAHALTQSSTPCVHWGPVVPPLLSGRDSTAERPAGASTSAGRGLRTASLPPCAVKADGGPGQGREAPWHSPASRGQEVALWLSPEGRMSRSYRRRWRRTAEAPHTGLAGHRRAHSAQGQRGPRPEVRGGAQHVHAPRRAAEWP